jgi:hypothetical protein
VTPHSAWTCDSRVDGRSTGKSTVKSTLRSRRHISYYNNRVEIHSAARKHGIADEDIEHATAHAMAVDDQDDDTRLYLGSARNADLLEVLAIVRDDGSELAIHAMKMRSKYRRLLPGE